jgi:hypothetical protein
VTEVLELAMPIEVRVLSLAARSPFKALAECGILELDGILSRQAAQHYLGRERRDGTGSR